MSESQPDAPGMPAPDESPRDAVETAPDVAHEPSRPEATITDLTLADLLAYGLRRPVETWIAFWETIRAPEGESVPRATQAQLTAQPVAGGQPADVSAPAGSPAAASPGRLRALTSSSALLQLDRTQLESFGLLFVGLVMALLGSSVLTSGVNRTEGRELNAGAPWLLLGVLLWLMAGVAYYREDLAAWWGRLRDRRAARARQAAATFLAEDAGPREAVPEPVLALEEEGSRLAALAHRLAGLVEQHMARIGLAGFGLLLSIAAYVFNGYNTFTTFGVFVWVASVVCWVAALTPPEFDLVAWAQARRAQYASLFSGEIRLKLTWTAVALIAIMLIAAYFRFAQFDAVPPEMTSDHVEKLLDAQRVLDGTTQVFFPNNGGREAVQFYLVAIFSRLSGLGMTFATLKWVSILEGLITIPVLWWMGRALIGEERPEFGNAVGLILAALVAVSYWHVALSRLALRIVLTPLVMSLVLVYLARGMRYNRRADFLKAGLVLGIGLYCYQAVRMIPVVITVGVLLAVIFRAKTWAERRRYAANYVALVIVALAIFVPLLRFWIDSPNLFWMRAEGRLFGDDVITETDPVTQQLVERNATLQDRINAFIANLPGLGNNIRNALLMYNWKGDVAWINGAPNEPAMDWITGALLVLGLAGWSVHLVRRGDVVDWLVIPAIFIMLLPSALSIAFPVENPSATRTSGSLPLAYFVAAYGLAWLLLRFEQTFRERGARVVSVAFCGLLVLGAYSANSSLYFGEYVDRYTIAAQPYTQVGRILRGFAESEGSYGNAFMVAYPYWFDHRAIGIEAGRIDWPNGLVTLDELAQKITDNAGTPYAFDPDRAVLFFYNAADGATQDTLLNWFPDASIILQTTPNNLKDFFTLIAPPPGRAWLDDFLAEELTPVEN